MIRSFLKKILSFERIFFGYMVDGKWYMVDGKWCMVDG
jgi:hypothetical protein